MNADIKNMPSDTAIQSMLKWGSVLVNNDPFLLSQLAKAFDDHTKRCKDLDND